jgi:hypothetical protein
MVDLPNSDEAAAEPPRRVAAGCNIFFLMILVLLVAALASWAFLRNPPSTPAPSKTGNPSGPPGGNGG